MSVVGCFSSVLRAESREKQEKLEGYLV